MFDHSQIGDFEDGMSWQAGPDCEKPVMTWS